MLIEVNTMWASSVVAPYLRSLVCAFLHVFLLSTDVRVVFPKLP